MNVTEINNIVLSDPGLSQDKKDELLSDENKARILAILSGTAGAYLGNAVAKYNDMGTRARMILGGLGFGAGMLIYNYINRDKFSKYNDKTRMYEINDK